MHTAHFNDLAIFGSEFEDAQGSGDREPTDADVGEDTSREDSEPSLGSLEPTLLGGYCAPEALNPKNVDVIIPPEVVLHGVSTPNMIKCDQTHWGASDTDDLQDDPAEKGEPDDRD